MEFSDFRGDFFHWLSRHIDFCTFTGLFARIVFRKCPWIYRPVTVEQYVEGSCVWRRGPRPGKGRNSRTRRTPSPVAGPAAAAALLTTTAAMTTATSTTVAPGYEQYQKSLLEVPWPHAEYGEASSDDLSSEWDSDVPEPPPNSKVNNGISICLYNNTQCSFTASLNVICNIIWSTILFDCDLYNSIGHYI